MERRYEKHLLVNGLLKPKLKYVEVFLPLKVDLNIKQSMICYHHIVNN